MNTINNIIITVLNVCIANQWNVWSVSKDFLKKHGRTVLYTHLRSSQMYPSIQIMSNECTSNVKTQKRPHGSSVCECDPQ